ncbi:RGCVC family protein [Actinomadura sp. DC4]|uniref:RGCVC family protein n=1 Tax=Actinomadura sp. DC4 TaxID=3055069 RepID=UPI00339D978F
MRTDDAKNDVSQDETPPSPLCACGHPIDAHDAVASRYCRATASGDLQRGCVCAPAASQ